MSGTSLPCWIDEAVVPGEELARHLHPGLGPQAPGCYTTARVQAGVPRFVERHVARLRRDAGRLGLHAPDEAVCRRALQDLARAAFGDGDGVVRLQIGRDPAGRPRLLGVARRLGNPPARWRAIVAPSRHPGPGPAAGAKLTGQPHLALAREAARRCGAEEAILLDRGGRVVEGARTNLVVVKSGGEIVTPPLDRGAVAGVAREIVREAMPELREADVGGDELPEAREIVALNAVRGARPIVRLEGCRIGAGDPGPVAARLAALLERAPCGPPACSDGAGRSRMP